MKKIIVIVLILFSFYGTLSAQLYTFKNFNHKNGTGISNVSALAEDLNGFMYVGTDGSGINQFDGKTFRTISFHNQSSEHHVTAIHISKSNTVYFSGKYTGFFRIGKNQFESINSEESNRGEFVSLSEIDDKFIFVRANLIEIGKEFGTKLRYIVPNTGNSIRRVTYAQSKYGVYIFTNIGNFFTDGNKIIPLHIHLNIDEETSSGYAYAFVHKTKLVFVDSLLSNFKYFKNGVMPSFNYSQSTKFITDAKVESMSTRAGQSLFVLSDGSLVKLNDLVFRRVALNLEKKAFGSVACLIDRNGYYYNGSKINGLFKVSIEPFTKLKLHPIYSKPNIGFSFRGKTGEIIISLFGKDTLKTFTATIGNYSGFKELKFKTTTSTSFGNSTVFGTNKGLKILKNGQLISYPISSGIDNAYITLLYAFKDNLYIGTLEGGLHVFDSKTQAITTYHRLFNNFPDVFYTAQLNAKKNKVFFGTNTGLFALDITKNEFQEIQESVLPYGCIMNSTVDKFGNIWFAVNKGLICITKNDRIIANAEPKFFPSTLCYTLNSDLFGNLYFGSPAGINQLKINQHGKILKNKNFSGPQGFEGYETHMRSQFQNGNNILVGTLDGIYLINAELLNSNQPLPEPYISSIEGSLGSDNFNVSTSQNLGGYSFTYNVINPCRNDILYRYRLKGYDDTWSPLTPKSEVFFGNLSGGDYVLEVQATFDGTKYSRSALHEFSIKVPFWKTSWFILFIIFCLIFLNFYFLNYKKNETLQDVFNHGKDELLSKNSDWMLGISGLFLAVTCYVSPFIDTSLPVNTKSSFLIGAFAIIGAILIRIAQTASQKQFVLKLSFSAILLILFYAIFSGNLHPFLIICLTVSTLFIPLIFNNPREVLTLSSLMLVLSVLIIIFVENPLYNKFLFLLCIFALGGIYVFSALVRSNYTTQFSFTSGVINEGNTMVISFDNRGIIHFASENAYHNLNAIGRKIIGQEIGELNKYTASLTNYVPINLRQEFRSGLNFKTPIVNEFGQIRWWEWTCKEFNENTHVIFGNDFTEKFEIETTFETLIDSAGDLIYQCDINGLFTFMNQKCVDVLGYSKEELVGKDSIDFAHPEFKATISRFYSEHFKQRKEHSYIEYPIVTKSRKTIWIGQNITTLFRPGNNSFITGYLIVGRDITEQREREFLINEQNTSITDSINYASRIQRNLLPRTAQMKHAFTDFFVLSKAKDIVSGDFHWIEEIDGKTIIICSDCTGHGVPGAFMTMLGVNLLNTIVKVNKVFDPGKILDALDHDLDEVLPRDGKHKLNDGMETSVCVFENGKLSFASAGGKIIIAHQSKFTVFKGDQKHIGDKQLGFSHFTTEVIDYDNETTVYLFTDGFQDQFGGERDKKYSTKKLISFIEKNSNQELRIQGEMLSEEFENWKGNKTQTDDITVIGVKKAIG